MKSVKNVTTIILVVICAAIVTGVNAATVTVHKPFVVGDTLTADDLNNRMEPIPTAINLNVQGIVDNSTAIGTNSTAISTNGSAISANSTAISTIGSTNSTNSTAISSNGSAISANSTAISTNGAAIGANSTTTSANGTAISTNTSTIGSNTSRSTSNDTRINSLIAQPCISGAFARSVNLDGSLNCLTPATGGNGDITEVNTGSGLTGGRVSGPVTLAIDPLVVQKRFTLECPVGEYVRGVNVNGLPVCIADEDTLAGLTCNNQQIPKKNTAGIWLCAEDTNTDSAGIAFAFTAPTDKEKLVTISPSTIQQVTLTAPGPGLVMVSYSGFYRMNHSALSADQLQIGISSSPNSTISSLSSRRFLYLESSYPAGEFYASVASHSVFTVTSAGTYTYYVLGVSNKTTSIGVSNSATQALFVPNNY